MLMMMKERKITESDSFGEGVSLSFNHLFQFVSEAVVLFCLNSPFRSLCIICLCIVVKMCNYIIKIQAVLLLSCLLGILINSLSCPTTNEV